MQSRRVKYTEPKAAFLVSTVNPTTLLRRSRDPAANDKSTISLSYVCHTLPSPDQKIVELEAHLV